MPKRITIEIGQKQTAGRVTVKTTFYEGGFKIAEKCWTKTNKELVDLDFHSVLSISGSVLGGIDRVLAQTQLDFGDWAQI